MPSPDPEALVISWGNGTSLLDDSFYADVPADSTGRFFTVERTGGGSSFYQDRPSLAIQAWAKGRAEASRMIYDFQRAAWSELRYHDNVARLEINNVIHFPSADNKPRYQALIELVTA